MQKSCKQCQGAFVIEPDDFAFYERIQVPPPKLCPQCRMQRRFAWRNGWHLFKKTEALKGEEIFSLFPQESPIPVVDRDYWFSDEFDAMQYGRDYDFSRPFFEQFGDLLRIVPEPAISSLNLVNCRYCMNVADCKNCYLVRGATFTEDSAYLVWDHGSKQCMDGHMTDHNQISYGDVNTEHCYKSIACVDCAHCRDVILCNDCVGCSDCVGCFGLRSKSYCIFNQQYSKEDYKKKLAEMNLGSHAAFEKLREEAMRVWEAHPHKFMHGLQNVNVSGDYIYESKNALQCYQVRGAENCKYMQKIIEASAKDCYDVSNFGEGMELCYEAMIAGRGSFNVKFCAQVYLNCRNIEYSIFCRNVSDLFGCISLRNKQYCILNKQYSPEDYAALKDKIIAHMKETGEYGEFFPASMSPFSYRISEAYDYFPLKEEEAKKQGFVWYDIVHQRHQPTRSSQELPDRIEDVSDSILQETVACADGGQCDHECSVAFRIIAEELAFLRRLNLPLPRRCPNCRLHERFKFRNLPMLYHRQCAKCSAEFETSYAPDRPEKIYCEACYNAEIL